MKSYFRIGVVLLVICLLGACSMVKMGRDFDVGLFSAKIEQGVTTQDSVRSWLGEPTSVGIHVATDGERFDAWDYYFAEGKMTDMNSAKIKILQVKFDKQGKMRGYNWSVSK